MDEELQGLVTQMVEAGVAEDKIKSFIQEYSTKDNGIGRASHIAGQVTQGVLGTTASMLKGFGESATGFNRGVSELLGQDPNKVSPSTENPIYKLGQGIEDIKEKYKLAVPNPKFQEEGGVGGFMSNDVPQGLGSTIPFMLATAAGAPEVGGLALEGQVLSKAGVLGELGLQGIKTLTSKAGVLGGATAIDQTFQEAREAGESESQAFSTALKNYVGGATEALPLERILGRLTKLKEGRGLAKALANTGKQMFSGGVEEGLQETLQQYWANQVAQGDYDPDRDPMMGVLRSGGSAFVVGMLIPFALNMPNVSKEAKNKIIRSLQPKETVEDQYDIKLPDQGANSEIDNEYAAMAKDIDATLKKHEINLTNELENATVLPTEGNTESKTAEPASSVVQPAAEPVQPTATDTVVPATSSTVEPVANTNNSVSNVEPAVNAPVAEHKAEELYHTSTKEITNVGDQHVNGGIMHLWQKTKQKSIGLFTVAPSTNGQITADERTDAVKLEGQAQEAHPNFPSKVFGNKTTKLTTSKKLNLLPTKDSGMDLHNDTILDAARKSKKVDQTALEAMVERTKGFQEWEKQAAIAAFLRTPEGGQFDGIQYANKVEKATKEAVEEDNVDYINKATKAVESYHGARILTALAKMKEKATVKGLTAAVSHIEKLEKDIAHQKELAAQEKEEKKVIEEKKKNKIKEAPVAKQKKIASHKGVKKDVEVWKGYFYKKIGTAPTEYAKAMAIDAYKDFREENGLKPITKEREKTLSQMSIKQSTSSAKLSAKVSAEEREKATAAIKAELGQEFGIDPETIEDISFVGQKSMVAFISENKDFTEAMKMPRTEISFEEFAALAPKSQSPILNALNRIVGKYKAATGTKIFKIVVPKGVKEPAFGGFQFSTTKSDNSVIAILVNETTGRPILDDSGRNSILHEYIHEYTKLMFHRLYSTNKSFSEEVNKAYKKVYGVTLARTQDLFVKLITRQELSVEDEDMMVNITSVLAGAIGEDKITELGEKLDKIREAYNLSPNESFAKLAALQLAGNLYTNFYAFTNPHEMMAEAFSDPHTVMFLSKIKMDEEIKSGINKGEKKSLLYKWYEDLVKWVEKKFEYTEMGAVANNALEHFMDVIGSFDQEFVSGDLMRQADPNMFEELTPEEVKNLENGINTINFAKGPSKAVKTYRAIVNKLVYTMERKPGIKSLQDVKDYLKGVNNHLPKNRQLDVDAYAPKILRKVNHIRKQRAVAKQHQTKLVAIAKANPLYKTSWKYREDVDDMAAVNIDNLSAKTGNNEVMAYINGLGMLSINGVLNQRQYNIMINAKKTAMLDELLPISDKINQTLFNPIPFLGDLANVANPATLSSIIGKFNTKISHTVLKAIYGGTMKSMARASIEASNFFQSMNDFAAANNFTHKELARIGLYGGIMSTVFKPGTKEWNAEVMANAKAALDAANNKMTAFKEENYPGHLEEKYIANEIALAQKIYDALNKNINAQILSSAEEKFYNKFKAFAKQHEADFERNSVGGWGNAEFQGRYNYFPALAQGSINKGGQIRENELLRGQADNLFDALSSGEHNTYGKIYGKKVWSNYRRTNPKGYFYENDALAIAKKWSKSMLYDLYATKELKAINRVLEDGRFQKAFKIKVRDAFKKHLRSIAGSGNSYDHSASKILKVRDKLYTAALATSGQLLLQSSSGFAAAAVLSAHLNPVTAMTSFTKAVKAAAGSLGSTSTLQKFLEDEGLGIQIRDILFEKYLSPEDYQKSLALTKIKGIGNKIENLTELSLRAGDKLGARLVWFAAYFEAGGTLEKPSKDAALAAERITGVMQNMSDMSFSAPAFKYNSSAQKILMGMFYAFKSFSINAALNTFYSARYSLGSKEARQVLAGQVGSILAYHVLAEMAIKPLYKLIVDSITGGDDDDEKRVGLAENILTTTLWDLGIGGWSPSMLDGLLRWVYNKNIAPTVHGTPYETFDKYMDSPIFSAKEPEDLYRDMLGPGFKDMATEGIDAIKLMSEYGATSDFLGFGENDTYEKAEKRSADFDNQLLRGIGTVYGGISGMPLRGDVKRIIDAVVRKQKARQFNERKGTKNGSEEPQYELQNYDLNQ